MTSQVVLELTHIHMCAHTEWPQGFRPVIPALEGPRWEDENSRPTRATQQISFQNKKRTESLVINVLLQVHMFTYIHYMISSNTSRDIMEVQNHILLLPAQPSLSLPAVPACGHSPYLCVAHPSLSLQMDLCGDFAGCKGLCPSCVFLPSCLSNTTGTLSVCRFSLCHVQWLTLLASVVEHFCFPL